MLKVLLLSRFKSLGLMKIKTFNYCYSFKMTGTYIKLYYTILFSIKNTVNLKKNYNLF